ncbi:uncharacterized protein [Antedon mediterranea]|uniref:uncharacterized protein n=1 Tax=Antedon mediterranea TaxID=105859 RepID=UPI003AF5F7AF
MEEVKEGCSITISKNVSTHGRMSESQDKNFQLPSALTQKEKNLFSPTKEPYRKIPRQSIDLTLGKSSKQFSGATPEQEKQTLPHQNQESLTKQQQPQSCSESTDKIHRGLTSQNESVNEVIKLMNGDINMTISQWKNTFIESEQYETFSFKQLDVLLAQAETIEKELLTQKEGLRKRLAALSNALKV